MTLANAQTLTTPNEGLETRTAVWVFLAFAAAYFCSALVRAITATLSPVLTQEFSLQARDLGLLAGGYFLGFAAMQLPLGSLLDRHGPKRVILYFLTLAVLGCLAFSVATTFAWLLAARVLRPRSDCPLKSHICPPCEYAPKLSLLVMPVRLVNSLRMASTPGTPPWLDCKGLAIWNMFL